MANRGRVISVIVCNLVFFGQVFSDNIVFGQTLDKFTFSSFHSLSSNDSVQFVGGQVADVKGLTPQKFMAGYLPLTSSLLSTEELKSDDQELSVWPNPCSDNLFLQFSGESDVTGLIEVYNSTGVRVISTIVNQPTVQLDVTSLSTGMYYIVFSTDDKLPLLIKFIKS